jgi:mono/diheme cytochrome c family protein
MVLPGLAMVAFSGVVAAQDMSLGQWEYQSNCAVCHGSDGKGSGAYVEFLKVTPADLTTLQKNNDGVFPFERVYGVIDGRARVGAHGPTDMPVWGSRYSEEAGAAEFAGDYIGVDRETYVRSRILALISYISKLQQ